MCVSDSSGLSVLLACPVKEKPSPRAVFCLLDMEAGTAVCQVGCVAALHLGQCSGLVSGGCSSGNRKHTLLSCQ